MTKVQKQTIRQFEDDHRSNPVLHNLHVRGAYEDLRIAQQAISDLQERSRFPASIMAGALHKAMQDEVTRSSAFFEAAALLYIGLEPPRDESEDDTLA